MKLKSTLAAFVAAACVASPSVFAGSLVTAKPDDMKFSNEHEFVQKFGSHVEKIGDGSYRMGREGGHLDVHFGASALRTMKNELAARIAGLRAVNVEQRTPKQAGELAAMETRHAQLERQLSQPAAKIEMDDYCGYDIDLDASASRGLSSGTAQAYATIASGNNAPRQNDWYAIVDQQATVAFPDLMGGLSARYDDYDYDVIYSLPHAPLNASVTAYGFYICARAISMGTVQRGNPFFPTYCGVPIALVHTIGDPECPATY